MKLFKAFKISLFLLFIVTILFLGTLALYLGKDQQTQYIAKEYNIMVQYLTSECNIDLNELQKQNIETIRCNTMQQLLKQGTIDYNQWLTTNCQTTIN